MFALKPAETDAECEPLTRIQKIVDEVSITNLMSILEDLNGIRHVEVIGEDGLEIYETRLIQRFESYGYSVIKQPVTISLNKIYHTDGSIEDKYSTMNNLIVEKKGTNPELEPILLTGHWDTVRNSPGINDNATACAAVLEAARLLSDQHCERSIQFILFAFEEIYYDGSYYYSDNLKSQPYGIINFDMLGFISEKQHAVLLTDVLIDFPQKGDFISLFTMHFSPRWALEYAYAIETFVPDLPYYMAILDDNLLNNPYLQDTLRSDQRVFWEKGVPGVFITDTAELRDGHPYHTSADTIENINHEFFLKNVKAGIAALCMKINLQS